MRFDYYERLSSDDRRVYRKSDAIGAVPLPEPSRHRAAVAGLGRALESERREAVEQAAGVLIAGLCKALGAPPVRVRVLARRPRNREGELHGLYTLEEDGSAEIEVWMKTAERRRVVAFRTFLRTLLHELGHHLDLTLFGLSETFHTEGFFRRESSLVRQLVGTPPRRRTPKPAPAAKARRRKPEQLSLFG